MNRLIITGTKKDDAAKVLYPNGSRLNCMGYQSPGEKGAMTTEEFNNLVEDVCDVTGTYTSEYEGRVFHIEYDPESEAYEAWWDDDHSMICVWDNPAEAYWDLIGC